MQQHTFFSVFFPSFFLWDSIVLIVCTSILHLVYMAQINFIGKLGGLLFGDIPAITLGSKKMSQPQKVNWSGPGLMINQYAGCVTFNFQYLYWNNVHR